MKNVIITQIKNQEERVYDWMLYHLNEGFDTFVIFDDFSLDKTLSEILRFHNDYEVRLIINFTDEIGKQYSIEETKNSEIYGFDNNLHRRLCRSYYRGNEIVKSINPNAICSFLDVDEFLVTNEDKNVSEVIQEIFEKENCSQIMVYNFDVRYDYVLENNLIYKNENYYRWDFDDVDAHPIWRDRKKCITISKTTGLPESVHEINRRSSLTYDARDYNKLRMHHFRIPNLPNSDNINFVLDNTIKEKMINYSNYENRQSNIHYRQQPTLQRVLVVNK